ncbi:MAG: hypothetical protein H8D24_06090 [Gammaproteobacteria bacterium]|uniref:Uncharacterized protein n=1 Tax=Candidatus Thiopontia autotrophica TaxID=2841688 RepID=A0A8J6P8Q0_9GAMM|nr:hypothetical protein [Candidatus Thiopontia autotrophica]MBL6969065.1 hypothetical protein [Gammaproteobacteria bacterium]
MKSNQNAWLVKRVFHVASSSGRLEQLPDVLDIVWNSRGNKLYLTYDIRTTDYLTVLNHLSNADVIVRQTFWSRLLGKFHQYSDRTGRENASARPAPCCNKPPK